MRAHERAKEGVRQREIQERIFSLFFAHRCTQEKRGEGSGGGEEKKEEEEERTRRSGKNRKEFSCTHERTCGREFESKKENGERKKVEEYFLPSPYAHTCMYKGKFQRSIAVERE